MSDVDAEMFPWEIIAEFSDIDDVLNLRLVSRALAESMSQLSPYTCASFLQARLIALQLSLVTNKTWKKPCDDYVAFLTQPPDTSPLDTLLRTLRTLRYLPMEMAIAYSGKYGRHAIPLKLNWETKTLESTSFPECRRPNCATCRFRIPHDSDGNSDVYNYITIRQKDHRFDLTKFYPKCIPNLPADLCCPSCRSSRERTLVLSMLSYKSAGLDKLSLTFTPYNEDDFSEAEGDVGDSSEDDEEVQDRSSPNQKRARYDDDVVLPDSSFAFPHIHDDCSLPHRDEFTPPGDNDNGKFAISLHCTSCEEFGIVAPANPCMMEMFACHHATTSMDFAGRQSTVGVVLVRSRCHSCDQATLCRSCCLRQMHRPYANRANQEQRFWTCWCQNCNPSAESGVYCPTCAWMTTLCHHM